MPGPIFRHEMASLFAPLLVELLSSRCVMCLRVVLRTFVAFARPSPPIKAMDAK